MKRECPFALPLVCEIDPDDEYSMLIYEDNGKGVAVAVGIEEKKAKAFVEAVNGYYGEEKKEPQEEIRVKPDYALDKRLKEDDGAKYQPVEEKKTVASRIADSLQEFIDVLKSDKDIRLAEKTCLKKEELYYTPAVDIVAYHHAKLAKLQARNEELEKERDELINRRNSQVARSATELGRVITERDELKQQLSRHFDNQNYWHNAKDSERITELEKQLAEAKSSLDKLSKVIHNRDLEVDNLRKINEQLADLKAEKVKPEKGVWKYYRQINCLLRHYDGDDIFFIADKGCRWELTCLPAHGVHITESEAREFTKDWPNYEIVWGETKEAYEQKRKELFHE